MESKVSEQRSMFEETGYTEVTLRQAKATLVSNLEDGTTCPCCGQYAKLYVRQLNSGMAATLVWLVNQYLKTKKWIDIPEDAPRFVIKNREIGRLKHWGLVVQHANEEEGQKTSGIWKPTEKGIQFALMEITVPRSVRLFNNVEKGFSRETTDVLTALGRKFDYAELMGTKKEGPG